MKVVVICSSGGSAFAAARRICPHVDFRVITDRACGVEDLCDGAGITHRRIIEPARDAFSSAAAQTIREWGGCDFAIMFFSRLITARLFDSVNLLNIHPALLPAFPGLKPLRQAQKWGVRFFGATLHVVNDTMDGGPIIGQTIHPMPFQCSDSELDEISFLQRVALFVLAIELFETGRVSIDKGKPVFSRDLPSGERLNPMIANPSYLAGLREIQRRKNIHYF